MKLADDACARHLFSETQERPKRRESLDFWEGVITLDLCHYHSYLSLYGIQHPGGVQSVYGSMYQTQCRVRTSVECRDGVVE